MSRTVPTEYPFLDPDASFTPGTALDAGSGDSDPPHGPKDISRAIRHLFGYGNAGLVVPQCWEDAEAGWESGATYPVATTARWKIPHDPAFEGLRVTIDYAANLALTGGFRLKALELNKTLDLDTVSAGGAQRRVTADWFPDGMDRTYADPDHTLQLFAKGNGGGSKNKILGVWIERIPPTDIGAGSWYEGEFIPPDSAAVVSDMPLCADILTDWRRDLAALQSYRYKLKMQWSAVRNQPGYAADSLLSMLCGLFPNHTGVNTAEFGRVELGGGNFAIYGGRLGLRSPDAFQASASGAGWHSFQVSLEEADPLVNGRQRFQHLIADPELFAYLESVCVFGV